jgi:membrane protein implicated in regulation of membrane protease activity
MAFLHPGDLSLSEWLFLLVFWGGLFLAVVVVLILLLKYIVDKRERRQGERK